MLGCSDFHAPIVCDFVGVLLRLKAPFGRSRQETDKTRRVVETVVNENRFCTAMLPRVSRTFALGIRLLPRSLEDPITIGYLLCRIADTIEDDRGLAPDRKLQLLDLFRDCFARPDAAERYAADAGGAGMSAADRELVDGSSHVFRAYRSLDPASRGIIKEWVSEMTLGMQGFVRLYPAGIRIQSLAEFKRYCYFVAGTVGHLLTDLWHAHSPFVSSRTYAKLLTNCEAFGEALQTVNILKDIPWDVEHENAVYIPRDLLESAGSGQDSLLDPALRVNNRHALESLVSLADSDLDEALEYVSEIPPAAMRIRLFCVLPTVFAAATLRELKHSEQMLVSGGGVKITRSEVKSLILAGSTTTLSNTTLRWLMERVRNRPFVFVGQS
jgi:farnesyl-diphosphate farnesyltransferase